jgi:hypothetical protein
MKMVEVIPNKDRYCFKLMRLTGMDLKEIRKMTLLEIKSRLREVKKDQNIGYRTFKYSKLAKRRFKS